MLCDLAETYHIYDLKQLPLNTVAVFCYGLKNDSRIKMKLRGETHTLTELILAMIYDRVSILQWYQTEDGVQGINPPEQLTSKLLGMDNENNEGSDLLSFDSGSAFDECREKILKGAEVNGHSC